MPRTLSVTMHCWTTSKTPLSDAGDIGPTSVHTSPPEIGTGSDATTQETEKALRGAAQHGREAAPGLPFRPSRGDRLIHPEPVSCAPSVEVDSCIGDEARILDRGATKPRHLAGHLEKRAYPAGQAPYSSARDTRVPTFGTLRSIA
jgi:hypothetical protein